MIRRNLRGFLKFFTLVGSLAVVIGADSQAGQRLPPVDAKGGDGTAAPLLKQDSDLNLSPRDKDLIVSQGACVIFFKGNDLTKDRSSCCTQVGKKMSGCWKNDAARSMRVYGPPGTKITVFDDPDASTGDDYFVIEKCDSDPVEVGSFQDPTGRVRGCYSYYFYSGGNGLDGKVSTSRWLDPRI